MHKIHLSTRDAYIILVPVWHPLDGRDTWMGYYFIHNLTNFQNR